MNPRRRAARDVVVAAIVVAVLAAMNWWASDSGAAIDLSATHRFSLSADSRRVVRQVDAPLHVTVFLNSGASSAADARFLLARYHELNHRISYRVVDPDAEPTLARRYGVTAYSTVVVEYRGRRVDAPDAQELSLSTALLEVLQGAPVTVCALSGHGEDDLTNTAPSGLSTVAKLLKDNDYRVRTLDLTVGADASMRVPDDCAVVMVNGARDPLQPGERAALVAYGKRGGRLAVLATPLSTDDPNPILNPWGIHFVGGLVVDPNRSAGTDLSNLIIEDFPSTSPVDVGVSRLEFPAPGALVGKGEEVNGLTVEALAVTSRGSYVAPDPSAQIGFQPGDQTGPVTVAAAADASRVESGPPDRIIRARVFATGTDLWATNQFVNVLSNRRLLVNAMAWLTERNQLLVATNRPADTAALPFTADRQTRVIEIAVGFIPGSILALGLVRTLVRRRHRQSRGT